MANPYSPLPLGAPVTAISRSAYNGFLEMLAWWKSSGRSGTGPLENLVDWDQAVFSCRNDSGADVDEYGVVGIAKPLILPTENEREFLNKTPLSGVSPTVAAHLGKWAVFLAATPNGIIGKACVSGVVPVRVYVTATTDKACDVVDGKLVPLGTGGSGAQILWLDPTASASTIAWAIVRLGTAPSALTCRILYDDVAPGDIEKNAWPVKDDMTADTDADKVLVQNIFDGTYRGFGTNHSGFTPDPTAKVWTTTGSDGKEHIVAGVGRSNKCTAALTADAAPGASVTVDTVVALDGGQLPVADSSSATIVSCTMPPEASALDNAPCIIEWNETADTWKIVWVQQRAKMLAGTLAGALLATTTNQTVTSPVSMDGGQVPAGTLTAYNVYTAKGFAGPSGGRCVAAWNEGTDHYEFIDVECT